jgi:hypothetical protein
MNAPKPATPAQRSLLLRERYPIPHADEPVYVLRAALNSVQVDWNAEQLEKSADARVEHAKALRAYGASRFAA